jgi:hypothetical protein
MSHYILHSELKLSFSNNSTLPWGSTPVTGNLLIELSHSSCQPIKEFVSLHTKTNKQTNKQKPFWPYICFWIFLTLFQLLRSVRNMKLARVAYACNPDYLGDWDQEEYVSIPPQTSSLWELHFQNNQTKMDWRYGSRGRVPAL